MSFAVLPVLGPGRSTADVRVSVTTMSKRQMVRVSLSPRLLAKMGWKIGSTSLSFLVGDEEDRGKLRLRVGMKDSRKLGKSGANAVLSCPLWPGIKTTTHRAVECPWTEVQGEKDCIEIDLPEWAGRPSGEHFYDEPKTKRCAVCKQTFQTTVVDQVTCANCGSRKETAKQSGRSLVGNGIAQARA